MDFALGAESRRAENAYIRFVNYMDNPWFPDVLDAERKLWLKNEPDRYEHIWLGKPDDDGTARKVLPYALLEMCVRAWGRRDPKGKLFTGLDVADSGMDWNSMVMRRGPCITDRWRWKGSAALSLGDTARRFDGHCRNYGSAGIYDRGVWALASSPT